MEPILQEAQNQSSHIISLFSLSVCIYFSHKQNVRMLNGSESDHIIACMYIDTFHPWYICKLSFKSRQILYHSLIVNEQLYIS